MLHTVLGGEQQIRRSDGGTIIPVELLQLDGPDGAQSSLASEDSVK